MTSDELKEHEDRFYIAVGATPADVRTLVLKDDETFGVFNYQGDIDHESNVAQGLFTDGMRHLSRFQVRLANQLPLLLGSKITDDNARIIVDLTNPDVVADGHVLLPRGVIHLSRSIFLWRNCCFERMSLANYGLREVEINVQVAAEADFADIFEVRGMERVARGKRLPPRAENNAIVLEYEGLDDTTRRTRIQCAPNPAWIDESQLHFRISLPPRGRTHIDLSVKCEPASGAQSIAHDEHVAQMREHIELAGHAYCQFETSNQFATEWLRRSMADVRTLLTETAEGPYPYAGVPWFSAPFGRDGIITALELLWVNPDIARGVLSYLAKTQAQEVDPHRDAEPGKILHERRTNEMAATGEVPFGRYYGSVDATPLFLTLAGAYFHATADRSFIESIWPHLNLALNWIDEYGDADDDGFVEYRSDAPEGLVNQGWKDSHDAVFDEQGLLAHGPIALCEVQGYVYDAKRNMAALAAALGDDGLARRLAEEARTLKVRFNQAFWCEEIGTYGLALDGHKRLCAVRSSNAGHALFSGIANEDLAARVCRQLISRTMHSGWGIRTVGSSEVRYNPMSYHNGSVWPHDNAIITAGFSRYGFRDAVLHMFRGWFDASTFLDLHRLPELFCGFRKRQGKGPTLYPVACSPQAWAAGAVFMMLASCLGISVDGERRQFCVQRPRLPASIDEMRIKGLRVADASLDLLFHREGRDVGVLLLQKQGVVDLIVRK
jgi:glycogen debranching enzyme